MLRASYSAKRNPIADVGRDAFPKEQSALFCWTTYPMRIIIKEIASVCKRFRFFFLQQSGLAGGNSRGERNMMPKFATKRGWALSNSLILAGLGLALAAVAPRVAAQQNQPDQASEAQTEAPAQDSQPQKQQDAAPQSQQTQQPDAPQPQGRPDLQGQEQPNQTPPPQTLTLPAGTVVRVRIDEWISTDRNATGDDFSAVLDQPIVVNGWVVARRGQAQTGRVSIVKQGGHGGGASQLGVELPELTLVDGQQVALQTQLFQTSAGNSQGRNVAAVGTTTGVGAVIGAIAGGGTGAAIGAGVGATAGIIGVMSTPGRPTVIPPETVLSFRLQVPVTISTSNSQFVFQPVTQSDYDSHTAQSRPRMARPGPPPPPGYYPYPYAYGYPYPWYPVPFVGFGYYGRFGGYRP
jgi:hypothetical protein